MQKITILLLVILLSLFGCKTESKESNVTLDYKSEIQQLTTDNAKKLYLENIITKDQAVRNGDKSASLMLEYGKDSKEYMEYVKSQWKQDEINLKKIETYLQAYGYPKKEMGEKATSAPWMVIHHAQGYETRERNFEYVYGAYLSGDIDDGAISFYLGRMYQMRNGKRLDMQSPYSPDDEINTLIKELNLEERKGKVLDDNMN